MIFFLSIVHLDYIKKKKKKILDPLPPQSPSFATLYIRASINLIDALCLCRHGKCCYSFRRRCFCLSFVSFLSFFFSFIFFSFSFVTHTRVLLFASACCVCSCIYIQHYIRPRERFVAACTCTYIQARTRKPVIYFQPEIERVTIKLFRRLFRRRNKSFCVCVCVCVCVYARSAHTCKR